MEILSVPNGSLVTGFGQLNLKLTLDCGQAFRWKQVAEDEYLGVAYSKETIVKESSEGLLFKNTSVEDVSEIWLNYFDLETDYQAILDVLSQDHLIKAAVQKYSVIRILNQEPWETLCSFIISSCNNIPRIKGIISKLCEAFGEKTGQSYSFPSANVLASKSEDDLAFLKAGYRTPYILDAAKKVAGGEINFEEIRRESEQNARKHLMKIKGVGTKVADCTMLFSLGFRDVYPMDVHIKRATEIYYPLGLPSCFSSQKGLAQQYIFHFQRMKDKLESEDLVFC